MPVFALFMGPKCGTGSLFWERLGSFIFCVRLGRTVGMQQGGAMLKRSSWTATAVRGDNDINYLRHCDNDHNTVTNIW